MLCAIRQGYALEGFGLSEFFVSHHRPVQVSAVKDSPFQVSTLQPGPNQIGTTRVDATHFAGYLCTVPSGMVAPLSVLAWASCSAVT